MSLILVKKQLSKQKCNNKIIVSIQLKINSKSYSSNSRVDITVSRNEEVVRIAQQNNT
jgi:hypothetical protein